MVPIDYSAHASDLLYGIEYYNRNQIDHNCITWEHENRIRCWIIKNKYPNSNTKAVMYVVIKMRYPKDET